MFVRIICNSLKLGGGERSALQIVRMLMDAGHAVVWHPTTDMPPAFRPGCPIGAPYWRAAGACDLLLFVANNTVAPAVQRRGIPPAGPSAWDLAHFARRRVMLLNWRVGDASRLASIFDYVAFLSTTMQREWLDVTGWDPARTWVHAPAVELSPFLAVRPDYEARVLARHSYPQKWPADTPQMLAEIREAAPGWRFRCMGMPPGIGGRGVERYEPDAIHPAAFLAGASLYWYPLPPGATEQGPRVIVEAMAAGLPCMVDDRDGLSDRVTDATGWQFPDHADYARTVARLTASELREKGEAARERARTVFDPYDWLHWLEEVAEWNGP